MSTYALILAIAVLQAAAPQTAAYTTSLSLEQMRHKQAVVETSMGTFIIDLLPEAARRWGGARAGRWQ